MVRWGAKSGDWIEASQYRNGLRCGTRRTDLEDLAGVAVDNAVEIKRVAVEVLIFPETGVDERLLETKALSEPVLVTDGPAVACRGNARSQRSSCGA